VGTKKFGPGPWCCQDWGRAEIPGTLLSMNVVYFTLGESIADIQIRTQLLRVPEVLADLRLAQNSIPNVDMISMMGSQDMFMKTPKDFQLKLAQLLQEALFKRWKLSMARYDLILERRKFNDVEWRKTLRETLRQTNEYHFYVMGPGFDNLEYEIGKIRFKNNPPHIFLHEVISEDPMLEWFWPGIMQGAKLSA
jgi:hypothetical protein